ncbi:MAG: leucine-rich repeat domain-containing protein [Prevotella sp.]|nr:leucine-rich repeat domain-containing protein [Prevotella sp.]
MKYLPNKQLLLAAMACLCVMPAAADDDSSSYTTTCDFQTPQFYFNYETTDENGETTTVEGHAHLYCNYLYETDGEGNATSTPQTIEIEGVSYQAVEITYVGMRASDESKYWSEYSGVIKIPAFVTNSEDADSDNATQYCVTRIGDHAFDLNDMTNVITAILYDDTNYITSIGDYAFNGCANASAMTIPSGVTTIGDYAYFNCASTSSITIPASVTSIGEHAFANTGITTFDIPSTLTEIGTLALASTAVTTITVSDDNPNYCSLDGVMFSKDKTTVFYYPNANTATSYNIPSNDGVTTKVGDYAFYQATKLQTVNIGSDITAIGDYAFYNSGLTSLTLPGNVTTIGDWSFASCNALTSLTFNDGLTSMGERAFSTCISLTSIGTLPATLNTISKHAFSFCYALTTVTIPGTVETIGESAFTQCTALETLTLAEGVKTIESAAFQTCSSLANVSLPNSLDTIANAAFAGLISTLKEITIPDGVKFIGDNAFYGAGLEKVTIGTGLEEIYHEAFGYCTSLKTMFYNATNCKYAELDCSATYMDVTQYNPTAYWYGSEYSVFEYCTGPETVVIGSNVESIPGNLFFDCTALKTIYSLNTAAPVCLPDTTYNFNSETGEFTINQIGYFLDVDKATCWLIVPEDHMDSYQPATATVDDTDNEEEQGSAAVWADFTNAREITVSFNILTTEGYATHYSDYSYTLEDGLEAAIITDASDGNLTMDWRYGSTHDEKAVPEKTAVLIRKTSADSEVAETADEATGSETSGYQYVNWTIAPESDIESTSSNMLYGSQTAVTTSVNGETEGYLFYKLAYFYPEIIDEETGEGTGKYDYDNGTLGFYWGDTEGDSPTNCGGPFTNGAKLAWLAIPKDETETSGDAKISFYPLEGDSDIEPDNNATDNETTGITAANTDVQVATKTIYNLQGVRVNDMSKKGIYIVDGRKVVKQ